MRYPDTIPEPHHGLMPTGRELVGAAAEYIGVPYLWGGKTGAGLDCSGLVFLALADLGVPFVHGSAAQIDACRPISVDEGWATPGALLWRDGHDAISTGLDGTLEAVPYAWAQGTVSLPSSNAGSSASVNVTFPTGRFPIIPRVMAWSNAARLAPILTTGITSSGCTITAWNWTSSTAPASTAIWRAMIMSENERDC